MIKKLGNELGIFIALIGLIIFFTIFNQNFISLANILNLLRQVSINGLIAIGMTLVIITAGIDLSVGSILGLSGIAVALLLVSGVPPFLAIILTLLFAAVLGWVNGILISKYKLQPFIVTLATMTTYRGITYIVSNGKPISNLSEESIFTWIGRGSILGVPVPIIIFLSTTILFYFVMTKTVYGRNIYATGGNEEAAKLAGINVERIKISVYTISGILAAIAGLILVSRLDSAQPTLGSGYELDAIAAVVIGGTSLAGGKGRITGTFIGILIIGVLSNGLNIMGVSSFYQEVVKGLIILAAVLMDKKNNGGIK